MQTTLTRFCRSRPVSRVKRTAGFRESPKTSPRYFALAVPFFLSFSRIPPFRVQSQNWVSRLGHMLHATLCCTAKYFGSYAPSVMHDAAAITRSNPIQSSTSSHRVAMRAARVVALGCSIVLYPFGDVHYRPDRPPYVSGMA